MIVTDASVWVSLFRLNDIHRQASMAWLMDYTAANGELIAPVLLLAEVGGAVARRTGQSHLGHAALQQLVGYSFLRFISLDQQLAQVAAEIAVDYQLRGADAIYAAVAYSLSVPLVTWDQEQIKRVQKVIKSGIPGTNFSTNGSSSE
jgi:predicted nucleic acid-binding protein